MTNLQKRLAMEIGTVQCHIEAGATYSKEGEKKLLQLLKDALAALDTAGSAGSEGVLPCP